MNTSESIAVNEPTTSKLLPWLVCLSAGLFFFYEFIQMNMFDAISTDLMQAFHVTAKKVSVLSATYFWANTLFLIPAGMILDRLSTRKLIMTAMSLCILGTVGFAISTNYWLGMSFHFLAGIGNAFCFLSCIILAARWFPPNRIGLVIGLIVTLAMFGGVVAHTPLKLLTQAVGWQNAVYLDGLLGLILLAVIWLFVKDYPKGHKRLEQTETTNKTHPNNHFKKAASNPQNWYCGFYISFTNLPLMVLGGLWATTFLTQVHHLSATQATLVASMLFFGTIVASPIYGAISDHLARRRSPMIIGALLSLGCVFAIMYIPGLNFTSLLVLFALLGLFTSSQVLGYPTVTESNPEEITGTAMGIASVLIMGLPGLVQPLFGYILDHSATHQIVNGVPIYSQASFSAAFWMFPIVLGLALVMSLLLKDPFLHKLKD